jgi:alpha-beta hydrolase superfamily lysophospholipase
MKEMLVEKVSKRIEGDCELDVKLYIPDGNKQFPGILFNHGFLSAKEEFGNLPEHIAAQGYVVMTYDYRGHGKSEGDRGYYTSGSHINDSERALKFLASQVKVIPEDIAVIGHSLGTVATARLVTETEIGRKCKTCLLLAPPRKFSDSITPLELNAYKLISKLAWPYLLITGKHIYLPYQFGAKDIFVSPEAVANAEKLNFLQKKMSVNNYYYMIKQINNQKFASEIKMPTLVMVAKNDKLIPNSASKEVFEAIPGSPKKYIEIENTGHSMMADANSAEVEKEILDWLKEML